MLLKFHGIPWNHKCCSSVVWKVPWKSWVSSMKLVEQVKFQWALKRDVEWYFDTQWCWNWMRHYVTEINSYCNIEFHGTTCCIHIYVFCFYCVNVRIQHDIVMTTVVTSWICYLFPCLQTTNDINATHNFGIHIPPGVVNCHSCHGVKRVSYHQTQYSWYKNITCPFPNFKRMVL